MHMAIAHVSVDFCAAKKKGAYLASDSVNNMTQLQRDYKRCRVVALQIALLLLLLPCASLADVFVLVSNAARRDAAHVAHRVPGCLLARRAAIV